MARITPPGDNREPDPRWNAAIEDAPNSRKVLEDLRDTVGWHEVSGRGRGPAIITSPGIQRRYAATLERLARERNEAAYEWTRLRWWQWRKRKRLWRKLYGIGGWSVLPFNECDALGIPRRVVPTHIHRRRIRWGFSK